MMLIILFIFVLLKHNLDFNLHVKCSTFNGLAWPMPVGTACEPSATVIGGSILDELKWENKNLLPYICSEAAESMILRLSSEWEWCRTQTK